jgi:hypothetical protein
VYGIHKEVNSKKPRHFLDAYLKTKAIVPPPNTYNLMRDLTFKQNPMHSKSPRIMECEDIARKAKIYKKPEPTSYKPNFTLVENRTIGCFSL